MGWTERYLAAVLRSIPEPKRSDVERELRSSIEDGIEERMAAGEDRSAAERAVLEGLGDPAQLAAAYTGRPTYLVGPELFPLYRRFVPRAIAVAAPIAAVIVAAVKLAGGGQVEDAITAGVTGALNVAVQIAFWATATFVFLEWSGPARQARAEIVAATRTWTLERLPKGMPSRISVGEVTGEVVTVLITFGILAFLATLTTTDASGVEVQLLAPGFASTWLPILLSLLVIRGAVHLMAYKEGRWTRWSLACHVLGHVTFAIVIIQLAFEGSIVNTRFAEVIGWPGLAASRQPAMLALAIGTTFASAWEIVRVLRRARTTSDAAPLLGASPRSA